MESLDAISLKKKKSTEILDLILSLKPKGAGFKSQNWPARPVILKNERVVSSLILTKSHIVAVMVHTI